MILKKTSGFTFIKVKAHALKTMKCCISRLISESKFGGSYFKPLLLEIIMF